MPKQSMNINVLAAAQQRIEWAFDTFERLYVSFSGGKDSTVMTHLVMEEAQKRRKKIGLLFVDLEGQYKLTIDHIKEMYELYNDNIEPYWIALPIHLRNAVSAFQPHWICWDKDKKEDWVRPIPDTAVSDESYFSFFRSGMEFEEFVPEFGKWYAEGKTCGCFVGIRSDESLNRFRTIANKNKTSLDGKQYTTWVGDGVFNVYPIYDWKTQDLWVYNAKYGKPYNKLYDRMYQAGLTIHQMRICQPYGDDQRKGLWLFHVIEPETWGKIVARVNGANQGALYSNVSGNVLGNYKISKPENHTWESFAMLLLGSMPGKTKTHYENKVAVFLKWYQVRGYPNGIPDDGPMEKDKPSWKRICKALLRNDYWCKGLSFSQHKSASYEKYLKIMKKRRRQWKLI
jgi:predicted phosphoadenosine phosphosulfate sulfurtransferase